MKTRCQRCRPVRAHTAHCTVSAAASTELLLRLLWMLRSGGMDKRGRTDLTNLWLRHANYSLWLLWRNAQSCAAVPDAVLVRPLVHEAARLRVQSTPLQLVAFPLSLVPFLSACQGIPPDAFEHPIAPVSIVGVTVLEGVGVMVRQPWTTSIKVHVRHEHACVPHVRTKLSVA